MNFLLIALTLFSTFNQKWIIPKGVIGSAGRILVCDTDRDGYSELIFTTYAENVIYFYELHPPNTWVVNTISYPWAPILWDSGDFDNDGLYDLVMQCGGIEPYWNGITIFESPDSFSCPTQEVWRDTIGPALILPICAYDMDRDSLPEIVVNIATPYGYLGIYESIGNNRYGIIFADNPDTSLNEAPAATIAFGDFDQDGAIEFVPAGGNDWYWVYECTGNNSYHKVNEGQLPTFNIRDCFTVPDADQDGKLEFVIKGFSFSQINAFIFEATSDNTYGIIKSFTFPGGDYDGGHSDAGDVDGDSVPEIVLEARQHVYIIKARGNDSFYVWDSLPGNVSGSSVRVTNDIDGNGLNEIVISGNNQTRIYEYVHGAVEEKPLHFSPNALHVEVYPNPFTQNLNIKLQTHANGKYSIKVYNVSGGLVNNIYDGAINRNTVINWNGSDENGRDVSQGVYFLKVENLGTKVIEVFQVLRTR